MTNENCLIGISCPNCGQGDKFKIVGTVTFEVTDNGGEAIGDHEWNPGSPCTCTQCDYRGAVSDFSDIKEDSNMDKISLLDKLEINKMLVISTGHLSKETGENMSIYSCMKRDEGWLVYCNDIAREEFPDDLLACVDFAKKNQCDYLMFDRDADTVRGLHFYDW